MLRWPRAIKLATQLGTVAKELASLRVALTDATARLGAAEERLAAQTQAVDELQAGLQHVRDQVDALATAAGRHEEILQQLDGGVAPERLAQLNNERQADSRKIALTLAKLEKRIDQQAKDAAITAAILLERMGTR